MKHTKHNWLKRLIALALVLVSLLQWTPVDAIAKAVSAQSDTYTPGDVNNDGRINALDVNLVRRHIAGGYDVKINTLAADVDADGYVTEKDVNTFRQFIAGGYGVVLKRGLERFTVKFVTGGGAAMADKIVLEGTPIKSLPTPYWAEHIFLGWYYDAALTQAVESDDKVTKNMTLYASWLEQLPLDTLAAVNFASAVDVKSDFEITVVSSDLTMTAQDVLLAIAADDLTNPDAKDIITVAGAAGTFTVRGNGGFREGGSYRISLLSDKLTFKDQPETAREYNFTVYRDEANNLAANADITYIPLTQVSNIVNNGQSVTSLNMYLYEANGDGVTPADLSTGSFTYAGELKLEDIICIYAGAKPTERTKDTPFDQLGDMAYLKITGVNGNTYTYENADSDDVVFTPDVLPMPESADTDHDANTVTVENKYLDYSADIYSYNNLDSQTTVEAGDFFAFYVGEYGVETGDNAARLTGYGKIVAVKANGNDTTTITFIKVTWEEIESCMDVYYQDEMSAQELLAGMDTEAMESEIEQQAIDSGFAEDAALYLTSLSLATDNFNSLAGSANLKDYKVTLKDGATVSPEQLKLMSGGSVNVEITKTNVKATISKNPTHLGNIAGTNADKKGISICLDVLVVIKISGADSDGFLEITITGSFIEEVGVDFGADVEAVWSWAVIIPYISDLRASANVDVMNYTYVSFNATMVTKEDDDAEDDDYVGKAIDMANEIKELLKKNEEEEDGEENHNKLIQRYSEMVSQESDWIRIVEKNITEVKQSLPFGIPLINISFAVDFVVQMDASISIGFDFEYLEGKRHVFTVSVASGKVYADTIDLVEKSYEFCFYAMGRIGLKVGIEMEFSIYAISKKLGSVGFSAGAGAYTKLYGYFFYELKYTQSQGKSQSYSGALLIQVGIYLELALEAQALGGRYSAKANLLDKEWLLYQAGRRDNVLDFNVTQEDVPEIKLKQFVRLIQLPDSFFNMDYLDLITGEGKNAIYNDWNDPEKKGDFRNGENYSITMTNPKFSYDPTTNTIAVHPDQDDVKLTGEMIVTWRKQPMSFSSKPIQRTISLYWDNLRDGYLIVPYANGGSYVPITIKNFEEKVEKPADPERLGYTFAGWYSDEALTIPYTYPDIMPNKDVNIYAKWTPRTDIAYTVEHYQEDFRSGEYNLFETETFTGTTDSYVTPETKVYTGYVAPAKTQLKVEADGSATIRYYYALERHTVTFDSGKIDGVDVTAEPDVTYNLKYGATITAPHMAMKGYTFLGWTTDGTTAAEVAPAVETEDLTYTAVWAKEEDTEYRIEYYVQQADGRYTLQHMIKDKTATGKVFTEEYLRNLVIEGAATADEKYILANAIVFENMTVKGIVCTEAAVDGSGNTVIKVNYGRIKHKLTFDLNYPGAEPIVKDVFYNAEVIAPQNVTRTGYTFVGWQVAPVTVMPAESLTYQAVWKANTDTAYKVEHYQQQLDGSYALVDTDHLTGTTDTQVTPTVKSYTGFTAPTTQTVTVKADGTQVVTYQYIRNSYTITFDAAGGTVTPESITAQFGESITLPTPNRTGYGFGGWLNGTVVFNDATMGAKDLTLTASWEAGKFSYTVNHYQQNVDGIGDTLVKTETGTADMDSAVTPGLQNYTGFTAPNTVTITITEDVGQNVVNYYYTRNQYNLTWILGIGSADGQTYTEGKQYYGAAVTAPVPAKPGYTFKWDATPVTVMPDSDLTYTALWTENSYTVTFHAYNGSTEEKTETVLYTQALGDNPFIRAGYTFIGWSDGVNTYGVDTPLSTLVTDGVDTYHLYAAWEKQKYSITYVGADNGHDNPTEYTVEDAVSLNAPNARPGYTFLGWYDNAAFDGAPVETITVGSTDHKLFYALWQENTYTVIYNANNGTGAFTKEELPYTGVISPNIFIRSGYTFAGWATEPDGAKLCDDIAAVSQIIANANGDNEVTLYAVWELNKYTITYELGQHAASTTHNNPTVYSMENGADIVLEDLTPKSGFGFGGWYTTPDFSGEQVKTIAFTDAVDYTLYAKWEHGGSFSITQTSVDGYKVTYTVKRTIPEGAVGTATNQSVYVRTQNGTAYGTTADSTGQDKYHFIHSYAVLQFGPNDTAKTFTVTEKDDYLENYVTASYQIGNKARTYRVEIYKVENTAGGLSGTIGTGSATRTMPVSPYNAADVYKLTATATGIGDTAVEVRTSGSVKATPADMFEAVATVQQEQYRDIISGGNPKYEYKVTMELSGTSGSIPKIALYTLPSDGGDAILRGEYQVMSGLSSSYQTLTAPFKESQIGTVVTQGNLRIGVMGQPGMSVCARADGTDYAIITGKNSVRVRLSNGIGLIGFEYMVKNLKMVARLHDANKPAVQYAAPMATTAYQKGDEAYITVIYNEPINSISGTPTLTLSSKLAEYFESPTYVNNGTGTNALVFKVKAKKDISADEIQNKVNLYLAFPVSGVGGSFSTNIGTLSATVKDIMGN